MPNFYCQFCGKEFKTEGGFDRHQDKCEKKARYEMLLIDPDLYANMHLICGKLYGKQFYDQGNKEKIFMAKEKHFKKVKEFTDYCVKLGVYSQQDFLMYLLSNKININKWCEEQYLINFLYDWLYYEDENHAIKRSEKWFEDRNLTLKTISPYRLFLALKYGGISIKYLKSKNFNWENNIDCDSDEKAYLKYFLRG